MARIASKITEQTVLDTKRAATRLIALHGFEGMNLRMLADQIGVKAGSFYNHIDSKESLLHTLLADTMAELMAGLDAALQGAADPAEALRRFVAFHNFHAVRRDEVFIGNAELRSLSEEHRARIVAQRDFYEQRLLAILRAGEAAGGVRARRPTRGRARADRNAQRRVHLVPHRRPDGLPRSSTGKNQRHEIEQRMV